MNVGSNGDTAEQTPDLTPDKGPVQSGDVPIQHGKTPEESSPGDVPKGSTTESAPDNQPSSVRMGDSADAQTATLGTSPGTANEADDEEDDDKYIYSDDFEDDTDGDDTDGDETDDEDNDGLLNAVPIVRQRDPNPVLPATVTTLDTPWGSKVYVVGTAHFSVESQDDVTKTIEAVVPDIVMVELCNSRMNILQLDEEKLLEEAQNINMEKIKLAIKQSGVVQGILHLLFLSMSAHLTKQLGMAPGGEFRRAFQDAMKIPGCRLQLGDRPINITLQRALSSLSVWQKMRLAYYLITTKDPISKEDVEKCKQNDLLEEMLKEMTGEFPGLSQVFVQERDTFLAHSLKHAAKPLSHPDGFIPSVVVGVVGLGHVPGIVNNWDKLQYDVKEIMKVPERGILGRMMSYGVRISLVGIVSLACYRVYRWTVPAVT